jgi:hypothetical protein
VQCGQAWPTAAFDSRFLGKPTRKTCASCRSFGHATTQEELLLLQHEAHAAESARWKQIQAERELAALERSRLPSHAGSRTTTLPRIVGGHIIEDGVLDMVDFDDETEDAGRDGARVSLYRV